MGALKKDKKKPTGRTRTFTEANMALALERNNGVIIRAAEELGCSRRTIEVRMKESEPLRELVKSKLEETKDFAEEAIKDKMLKGDTTMLIFFAKTKMKDRGYIERVEHDMAFQGTMKHLQETPSIDLSNLSEEELIAFDKLLTKAGQPPLLS